MVHHGVFIFALFLFIGYGAATKCWTCSSDLDPQCADHFNSTEPGFNLHHTLTDCNTHTGPYGYPLNKGLSVCKKQKQIVNGEMVTIRACAWLHPDEYKVGDCPHATTPSYIKVEFCETCQGDGCNGASSLYTKMLVPGVLSMVLALIFAK